MIKINKDFNVKLIVLIILGLSFTDIVYSDPSLKDTLRPPIAPNKILEALEEMTIAKLIDVVFEQRIRPNISSYKNIKNLFDSGSAIHNMDGPTYYEALKVWCREFLRLYLTTRAQIKGKSLFNYLNEDCVIGQKDFEEISKDIKIAIYDSYTYPAATSLFPNYYIWHAKLVEYFDYLIDAKVKNNDFQIHIYSLGCASGEEPYSIAAVLYTRLSKYAQEKMGKSEIEAENSRHLEYKD
jgi:hypothetical protein